MFYRSFLEYYEIILFLPVVVFHSLESYLMKFTLTFFSLETAQDGIFMS